MSSINQNLGNNHKDILVNRKVVEHNDLVTSVAKMDSIPLKIFELAVSCIDSENPPQDNKVLLSKKELFDFFSVDDTNKHSRFKMAIEAMQKEAFFQITVIENKGYKFENIIPIPYIAWTDYEDAVTVEFNHHIMPYLIDLKSNFTQFSISDISKLDSKYSVIWYKWITMSFNQYETYKSKGERNNRQLLSLKNPSISIADLRKLTDTTEQYKRFVDLETWVLKKPLDEINQNTHYNITYEKIKKGRNIDSIQFHISKKQVAPVDYKEEQQDPVYLAEKEEKQANDFELLAQALESPYTEILNEKMLLGFKDMRDTGLMAGLQRSVYPLYDDLSKIGGLDLVETHLDYVSRHKQGYSKENIVKYLYKSVKSYLPRAKMEANNREIKQAEVYEESYTKPNGTVHGKIPMHDWAND